MNSCLWPLLLFLFGISTLFSTCMCLYNIAKVHATHVLHWVLWFYTYHSAIMTELKGRVTHVQEYWFKNLVLWATMKDFWHWNVCWLGSLVSRLTSLFYDRIVHFKTQIGNNTFKPYKPKYWIEFESNYFSPKIEIPTFNSRHLVDQIITLVYGTLFQEGSV